jgi:hypothetical protein
MRNFTRSLAFAALLLFVSIGKAAAAEPRPWLCRDKPAVSASKPMRFEAECHGTRRWQLFFMAFDPSGGHDGFTIARSNPLGSAATNGTLESGRYFAVALYLAAGHWVCPAAVEENAGRGSTAIADLTYSDGGAGSCSLRVEAR